MRSLLIIAALAAPAVAEPSFEVIDRGTALEVIAKDVKALRTAVNPTRQRLEVDLVGYPRAKPLSPGNGITIVELSGDPRVLTVKLPFERADVKRLARHAQAIQVGNDLHLLFPRTIPADGTTVTLPDPTIPAALANKLVPVGPQPPVKETAPPKQEAKPVVAEVKPEAKPEPKQEAKPFLAEPSGGSSNNTLYAMGGLCAIALGIWIIRKRKTAQAPVSTIDVIAQRALGNKAKVVWLTAGGREMIVAVTAQQVRMLGQWNKGEAPTNAHDLPEMTAYPRATTSMPRATTRAGTQSEPVSSNNPSVQGILRLRARTNHAHVEQPAPQPLDEEIATGNLDEDALWAKEILAATSARR
jgi:LPXTG-motif cell wall-anchored protein